MIDLAKKTKELCRLFEIKPSRSKGQNFLTNDRVYDEIVAAAEIASGDEILEVGPGLGFMTVKLAKHAKRVVAVELDREIFNYLKSGFDATDNNKVELVNEDILRFNVLENFSGPYKIVANLPYNISSIFLRLFSLYGQGITKFYGFNATKRSGNEDNSTTPRDEPTCPFSAALW